ncbi:poly(A) polymerase central domain-containing protein [Ditylenchus destructor]|nr:poly(A) polymerase central domain-containing protein [Ditylenchus destructor]
MDFNPKTERKKINKKTAPVTKDDGKSRGSLIIKIQRFHEEFLCSQSTYEFQRNTSLTKAVVDGLPWEAFVFTDEDNLYVQIECLGEVMTKSNWMCPATFDMSISPDLDTRPFDLVENLGEKKKPMSVVFKEDYSHCCMFKYLNRYATDNTKNLRMEIFVDFEFGSFEILEAQGTNAPYHDFTVQHNDFDVTLSIAETEVFVSKELLSIYSPYFSAMFYNDKFIEGQSANPIKLPEVDVCEFTELLKVIYPRQKEITARTWRFLLELADRFQIDIVLSKCENWLIENPGPSLAECLMLSERYRLLKLRQSSLDRLRYPATLVDLRKKADMKLVKHIILLSRRGFAVKASKTNICVPTRAEILSSSGLTSSNGTDHELELSQEIIKCLEHSQVFDTKHTLEHRRKAVNTIEHLLQNWISEKSEKTSQTTNSKSGKLITFGSFRLGVNTREADIDTVAIAPSHITSAIFFADFKKKLYPLKKGKMHYILPNAYAPIIRFEYDTVKFDILFCRVKDSLVLPNLKLDETFHTKCYDKHSIRSINSSRAVDEIIDMLPNYKNFVITLKAVKLWATDKSLHKIYHAEKNFRGITWTIMVAYVCKLFPNAPPSVLLAKFFEIFSSWDWNQHALTCMNMYPRGQDSFCEVLKGNLTCANFLGTGSTCVGSAVLTDSPLRTPHYSSKPKDAKLAKESAKTNRTSRENSKNVIDSMVESKHKPTSFYSQHSWKSDQICVEDFSQPYQARKLLRSHSLILLLALAPSRKQRKPLFNLISNMMHHFPLHNTGMAATDLCKKPMYTGTYKLSSERLASLNIPHTCSDSYYWLFKINNSSQNVIDSFQQKIQFWANHVENIAKEGGWLQSNMLLRAITIANVSREETQNVEETRVVKALPTRGCLEPTVSEYGDLVCEQKLVNPTAQCV